MMLKVKKVLPLLIAILLVFLTEYFLPRHEDDLLSDPPVATSTPVEVYSVERIIDGDTIELSGGKKVRFIGIDTPEISGGECLGLEAKQFTEKLLAGKKITMEKDVSEVDKYDRLLRYVFIGDVFINNELVKNGYAKASTFPPDVKYQNLFLESERKARNSEMGLWSSCF